MINRIKPDGKTFRQILPGEYTQMAGRAGRRGLDKVGTVVIMCWDDIPEEGDLRRLLTGKPSKLESQFRLTYSMILNLIRVEDLKDEDMLKRSFAEFPAQRALFEQQQQLLEQEGALSKMNFQIDCILGEPSVEDYFKVSLEYDKLGDKIQEAVMQSRGGQQALVAERVVLGRNSVVTVPTLGVYHVRIVPRYQKQRRAEQILRSLDPGSRIIMFIRFTKPMCDTSSWSLGRDFGTAAIHGDKNIHNWNVSCPRPKVENHRMLLRLWRNFAG